MNENAPTNKPEEEVDMSYVNMAEGNNPSVMDNLRTAQESGDPSAIAEAEAAADKKYKLPSLERLEEEKSIETQSEEELKHSLQKMNEQEESLREKGLPIDKLFYQKRFAVMRRLEDLRVDKLEAEMKATVQPATNLDRAMKFAAMRRPNMGDEGIYSSREEYAADALAVLNSGLSKDEKLNLLQGIGSQIESSVVGNDYSDVITRLRERLKASV